MNRRSILLWIVPCICVALVAMQLANLFPRAQLARLAGTSNFWKSYTSASGQQSSIRNTEEQEGQEKTESKLGLPEPSAGGIKLDVGTGEGVRLDHLGPMVVNKDGTLSRITNWDKMAANEKKNTLKMLEKRNKQRLDALQRSQGEQ